jgi:hypothetical protein
MPRANHAFPFYKYFLLSACRRAAEKAFSEQWLFRIEHLSAGKGSARHGGDAHSVRRRRLRAA